MARDSSIESATGQQWRYTTILAWRDLVHEWKVTVCLVLALAAVLTPLLILFGLKSGLVATMTERLKADPRNRQVIVKGNKRLESSWVDSVRALPETGFIVPRTRTLSATIDLVGPSERSASSVDMVPSAEGDPLITETPVYPRQVGEALLSHTVAEKLGAAEGSRIRGIVRRRHRGAPQSLEIPFTVLSVLPEASFPRDGIFVSVDCLDLVEDYRDQYRVPELGVTEGDPPPDGPRAYSGIRLYAATLNDVATLAERLRQEGFDVLTRARESETVQARDRVLSFIFVVVAGVGVSGFLLSLAASLWANVDRKRRELALLRLVGLRTSSIVLFPAAQSLMVAIVGIAVSLLSYALVSAVFNSVLAENLQSNEFVSHLPVADGLLAAGLTILFALGSSSVGGYRAARIDPAESLRDI